MCVISFFDIRFDLTHSIVAKWIPVGSSYPKKT